MAKLSLLWFSAFLTVLLVPAAPIDTEEPTLIFPQIADGDGVHFEISLTNPGSRQNKGTVYFRDGSGKGLQIQIDGKERESIPYSIAPGGAFRVRTDGVGVLKIGYALLITDVAETALTGNVSYTSRGHDITVPHSPQSSQYHVYSERNAEANSGIALVNLNEKPISVVAFLFSEDGTRIDETTVPLGPGEHQAKFITEIFEDVDPSFLGSVHAYSQEPFSMIGLRQKKGGSLALLAGSRKALPESASSSSNVSLNNQLSLIFPQFADGDGVRSEIILTNPAAYQDTGVIVFKSQSGEPLSLKVKGEERTSIPFIISAGGVSKIETDGSGELKVGYAIVTSEIEQSELTGTIIYSLNDSEVSVRASELSNAYHVFVEQGSAVDSGVAIANPSAEELRALLVLLDEKGQKVDEVALRLQAGEQQASYIDQIFEQVEPDHVGTLQVYADGGFSLLGLRQRSTGSLSALSGSPTAFHDSGPVVENLRALAKLFGYVRFFHPSDEASLIDWNQFAVLAASKVKSAWTIEELQAALKGLFLPIAPTIQILREREQPVEEGPAADQPGLKEVSWQHQGVGLELPTAPYRSQRINRTGEIQGKKIKLEAYVRAEVPHLSGQGRLWLRVDLPGGQTGFFDNMQDRPIMSEEWKSYEIVGDVAENAMEVSFGCFLLARGKVWVDDFKLSVSDDGEQWKALPIRNPGFEEVAEEPIGWWAASPGYKYQIEESGSFNGSNCLSIESSPYAGIGGSQLGTITQSYSAASKLFEHTVRPGETINNKFGAGLSCKIPLMLQLPSDVPSIEDLPQSFQEFSSQLEKIDLGTATAASEEIRVAAVLTAWSTFQHFYPYFDVVSVDWDAELTKALGRALEDESPEKFHETLELLVAALQDGHGRVFQTELDSKTGYLPIAFTQVDGEIVVTFSGDPKGVVRRGDILLTVDGIESQKLLAAAEQLQSGSPQWKTYQALRSLGSGKKGEAVNLGVRRGEAILALAVVRDQQWPSAEVRNEPSIREVREDIMYVDLDRASMGKISNRVNELAAAKGVIFDLRGYPNSNHDVIRHLIDEPVRSAFWMVPQIVYPDRENIVGWDTSGRWLLQPKEPRLQGKIVFLTDARAISYAESVMGIIENYQLAEIVGEPTAGTNGNVNLFTVPGNYRIWWTGMKVLKHDESQHHLIGIQPTVPVSRTLEGVSEGRDEYLERALELIENQF